MRQDYSRTAEGMALVRALEQFQPASRRIIHDPYAYVSAFPDLAEFRKHLKQIAWETEVWIAEMPDHLIHSSGDRFLGPR